VCKSIFNSVIRPYWFPYDLFCLATIYLIIDIKDITPKLALSAPQYWLPESARHRRAWLPKGRRKKAGKWKPLLATPFQKKTPKKKEFHFTASVVPPFPHHIGPFWIHAWILREQFSYLSQYSCCSASPLETQQSVTFQFLLSTFDLVTRCLRCDFPQRCTFITSQ